MSKRRKPAPRPVHELCAADFDAAEAHLDAIIDRLTRYDAALAPTAARFLNLIHRLNLLRCHVDDLAQLDGVYACGLTTDVYFPRQSRTRCPGIV